MIKIKTEYATGAQRKKGNKSGTPASKDRTRPQSDNPITLNMEKS